MLPFLKPKRADGGVMTQLRAPDEKPQESQEDSGLESAMKDLIDAVDARDHKRMAIAMKAAFEILDSMPHEEGPHTNEE